MKRLRFAVPPGLIPLYLLISFPFLPPYPTQLPLAAFPSPSEQTGGAAGQGAAVGGPGCGEPFLSASLTPMTRCRQKWERLPSRSQSTGDQLLMAKEKKKKEAKYPKGSIWARSSDLTHSWCSDFRISSVFRIARVCSWWGGGTRRGGRQTTKTRREVSPRHVLSWRLQIASLWANHNSNNDAGRRTWGHRLPETILSFARGS